MVARELVVQLTENAAHVWRFIYQENAVIHFSQVQSRPDSADPGSDYEG
jgi:hypothetical protein